MEKNLKALGILGTLKLSADGEKSNTEELLEEVFARLRAHGVETKTARLIDHDIKHGLVTEMDDDWRNVLDELLVADIVIFATPIWWGQPSSLMQKIIERMNQLDDEYMASGVSKLYHKVAGVVITGHEDGAQQVFASLANALIWYGFVLPPECAVYWVGEIGQPMEKDAEKRRVSLATKTMVGVAAHNLYHYAKMISENKEFLENKHKDINSLGVHCEICETSDIKDVKLPVGWRKRS